MWHKARRIMDRGARRRYLSFSLLFCPAAGSQGLALQDQFVPSSLCHSHGTLTLTKSQSVPDPCPGLKSDPVLQEGGQLGTGAQPELGGAGGGAGRPFSSWVSASSSVTWGHSSCHLKVATRTAVQERALVYPCSLFLQKSPPFCCF